MHGKKKQIKGILSCILLMIILAAAVFFYLRLHGSVVVKPNRAGLSSGEVVIYRQDDEAWAEDRLGDSRFTMKSSGCLVTCIASAVSMETGAELTPGALNQFFSDNNVYDIEGNIQWAAMEQIEGFSVNVFQGVSEPEIAQSLTEGHYPIVRVRMHGLGRFHYVLIVGTEAGEYLCMDPLENEPAKLSRYLDRVYAVRMVSFSSAR